MGKLLFIFCLSQGHMSVLVSLAKKLLDKYPEHEVYFNVDEEFAKKIQAAGRLLKPAKMEKLELPPEDEKEIEQFRQAFHKTGLDHYKSSLKPVKKLHEIYIMAQSTIEKVIEQVQPDVILLDQLFNLPFVENKNIPWGLVVSANPLYAQNLPNYPPAMSGLSVNEKKEGHLWREYRTQKNKSPIFEERDRWFKECGVPVNDNPDDPWILKGSDYLNFYQYPKYCDYFKPEELPGRWSSGSHSVLDEQIEEKFRPDDVEGSPAKPPGKELLTPEFMAKPGLLVLFSMGTIITREPVMNSLIDILGTIPHKFIVSCGPNYEKLKLPENCVGAAFLNQKELYPLVDCVVTHGGNNTFTELFLLHQKPFVVVACFGDQPDNATRINELNLGIGMRLADLGRESLKRAIERVTTDEEMKERMKEAGKLSEADDGLDKFADELHLYLIKQKK